MAFTFRLHPLDQNPGGCSGETRRPAPSSGPADQFPHYQRRTFVYMLSQHLWHPPDTPAHKDAHQAPDRPTAMRLSPAPKYLVSNIGLHRLGEPAHVEASIDMKMIATIQIPTCVFSWVARQSQAQARARIVTSLTIKAGSFGHIMPTGYAALRAGQQRAWFV